MKKQVVIGVIIGILVPLLFLSYSPPAASSQLGFFLFTLALGAIIIELWMLVLPIKVKRRPRRRRTIRTITKMNKKRIICVIVALVLTSTFAYASFSLAKEIQGSQGYATDETWYVSSARNILREVFGAQPSYVDSDGMHHYTIFFSSSSALDNVRGNFRRFIEREFDGSVVAPRYDKTAAVAIATSGELDYEKVLEAFPEVKIIQSGYRYPDAADIGNYLNTEHPPLVKYIIGFSMLTLGDEPINWRIPGIIAGSITILLVYLIVAKLINNEFIALFVYLFAFTDPILRAMSSIAMLDIYTALFIALSAWFAVRRNYLLSGIAVGLASSCKLTGVFSAGALLLFMAIHRKSSAKQLILYPVLIPFLVWLLFNFPLIANFGFQKWFGNIVGSLSWGITSRPPGPPASTPWGWFVNENVFWLNFNPNVSASVTPVIYFTALIALIFVPYLGHRINRNYLVPGLWFSITFLGYVFVYIIGNRTLYSFYAVTLSPMVYVLACVLVYYFIQNVRRHFKPVYLLLRNRGVKRILVQTKQNPKSVIQGFLKIYESSDPFMIRPHRVPKKRRTKRTKKHRSVK
jgi:predicted membrane-bound dolichyl-phosphate-mannose-protein mannosyltransferase